MGLSSLDAALTGLRVSQQQISVIANNVANVGTPGFSRKILPQSAQAIQGQSIGVISETIIRNVDLNLERNLWTQISAVNYQNIQQSYLQRVEQFHGPPNSELSVAAEVARLKDSFAGLVDSPEDPFFLANTVSQALDTANKINDLSNLITTLRNDAQSEMQTVVVRINDLLVQFSELNKEIKANLNAGRTTALLEDKRDQIVNNLSELIEIDFFKRGDGVLVIQTNGGTELASEYTQQLFFDSQPLSPLAYYPESAAAIYIGDPSGNVSAVDITQASPGGKLGGLLKLRDQDFPRQMAQLDEMAHKLALRFDVQGLRLFTDAIGNVPLDTAPDPTTLPTPTPVTYVGFSSQIQVNEAIIADNTLLQRGTTGEISSPGSNAVIRRVIEFSFGAVEYQEAIGTIDLRTSLQAAPNNTLQNWLGLFSSSRVEGSADLTAYPGVADILLAGGTDVFGTGAGETDRFTITFDDPDFGTGPHVITIDLDTVVPSGINAAQDLVNAITGHANWANAVADFNASVTIGVNGQLVIESRSDFAIAAAGVEPLSDLGFAFLGLNPGTHEARDPYFDIRVGNNAPTRITIDPNDNENDLFAQLSAVPGLALEDFTASVDGFLRMRPGNDYTDPEFGGDISMTGGPFQANGAGINAVIGAGTVPDTVNIISALFGSFSAGPPPQDLSPVDEVTYQSQTNASLAPPIPTVPFRTSLLGPGADISTNIAGTSTLIDFAQNMISQQAQELNLIKERGADEESLRDTLQTQFSNVSGVNLDEELAHLIVVQTAYAASARVVNAVDSLFRELLEAIG